MKLLESFLGILPPADRERIESYLDASGAVPPEKVRELAATVSSQILTLVPEPQPEKTSSEVFNRNWAATLADLYLLYANARIIGGGQEEHRKLVSAELARIEAAIEALEREVEEISWLADNNYDQAKVERFLDNSMRERNRDQNNADLFTDYLGNPILQDAKRSRGRLTLALREWKNALVDPDGKVAATIEILEETGQGFQTPDPNFSVDKAIDQNEETFWATVTLAPGVLTVPVGNIPSGAIVKLWLRFTVPQAVNLLVIDPIGSYPMELCELKATKTDDPNVTIPLLNFDPNKPRLFKEATEFHFQRTYCSGLIITLRQVHAERNVYTITASQKGDEELWRQIVAAETQVTLGSAFLTDPEGENPQVSQEIIDAIDPAWAAYVKALDGFYLSADDRYTREIVNRILWSIEKNIGPHTARYIERKLTKPKEPERIQVSGYEYVYGARRIDVYSQSYEPVSIWVSKPIFTDGDTRQVAIEVEEEHPEFYDDRGGLITPRAFTPTGMLTTLSRPLRRTHVEYYVSAETKAGNLWVPMLPLGETRVYDEIAYKDPERPRLLLRFIASPGSPLYLWRDGEPVHPGAWNWGRFADGRIDYSVIDVAESLWDPRAEFTVEYTPKAPANLCDFSLAGIEPQEFSEDFDGTDSHFSITLSHMPYVDRSRLNDQDYNPVQITLNPADLGLDPTVYKIQGRTSAITGPIYSSRDPNPPANPVPARLVNKTQYETGLIPELKPYDPGSDDPVFEYFHVGRKVYFTEPFTGDSPDRAANAGISHGNAIIRATYYIQSQGLRLKIILRRSKLAPEATPVVKRVVIRARSARS